MSDAAPSSHCDFGLGKVYTGSVDDFSVPCCGQFVEKPSRYVLLFWRLTVKAFHLLGYAALLAALYYASYLLMPRLLLLYPKSPTLYGWYRTVFFPARSVESHFRVPSEKYGWIRNVDSAKRQVWITMTPSMAMLVEYSSECDATIHGLRKGEAVDFVLGERATIDGSGEVFFRKISSAKIQTPPP